MKSNLTWAAVNALNWVLPYLAFWLGIPGALAVLKFICWFFALCSGFALADSAIAATAKKPRLGPVKRWAGHIAHFSTLGCLVWFGHPVTGAAYLWAMLVFAAHENEAQKLRRANHG